MRAARRVGTGHGCEAVCKWCVGQTPTPAPLRGGLPGLWGQAMGARQFASGALVKHRPPHPCVHSHGPVPSSGNCVSVKRSSLPIDGLGCSSNGNASLHRSACCT